MSPQRENVWKDATRTRDLLTAAHLNDQHTHGDGSQQVFVVIQPLLYLLIATLKTAAAVRGGGKEPVTNKSNAAQINCTVFVSGKKGDINRVAHQIHNVMTDPCPDGAGRVAPAARGNLLAAAVGDHVVVQGSVPVTVAVHATAFPLVNKQRRAEP